MQNNVTLILAAGQVNASLIGELGYVNTSLIPYKGKPLFISIYEDFKIRGGIFLVLDRNDEKAQTYANFSGISTILVDGGISLKNTCRQALGKLLSFMDDFSVQIIFGDTLTGYSKVENFIGVVDPQNDYSDWATLGTIDGEFTVQSPGKSLEPTIAGYFGAGSAITLFNNLSDHDFYDSLFLTYAKMGVVPEIIQLEDWKDFGRLNSFYLSRSKSLISRYFNQTVYASSDFSVIKSATDPNKIRSEILWYEYLAEHNLSYLAPRLVFSDVNNGKYSTEFISGIPLSDIFICANKSLGYWTKVLSSIQKYITSYLIPMNIFDDGVKNKIISEYDVRLTNRLSLLRDQHPKLFSTLFQSKYGPVSLDSHVINLKEWLSSYNPVPTKFSHGDLFFGNMFYDERTERILTIDPRGLNNEVSEYDATYDIAKLSHSLFGGYDFLASNCFKIVSENHMFRLEIPWQSQHPLIQDISMFNLSDILIRFKLSWKDVRNLESFIFLALAPLHQDSIDRQIAAICASINAFQHENV
jgi:hypothetical protein